MIDPSTIVEVLLVEDNPADAELCVRALKKHNFANNLLWVKDGEEALDYLLQRGAYATRPDPKPKVVLLDLRLPKVDGLEVLQAMRDDPRAKAVPVVVLTSSKEDQDIAKAYELGANSFICKPVDFAEFTEVVRQLGLYWLVVNKPPRV